MRHIKPFSLFECLIPIFFLLVAIGTNVWIFGSDSTAGSNQVILMIASAIAGLMAYLKGFSWNAIESGMTSALKKSLPSIFILFFIGAITGSWMLSGIVPSIIYYGLNIMTPGMFLFSACIVCSIVSFSCGSSWTTIGTIGVALLAIGNAFGLPVGLVAGAIISGGYFGDKMSPLSETTTLAAVMAGTDIHAHIRSLMVTTIPGILITLLIFAIIGLKYSGSGNIESIESIQTVLSTTFFISPWLLLIPVTVITLVAFRFPAIPALLIGVILGCIAALLFQGKVIDSLRQTNDWIGTYKIVTTSIFGQTEYQTSMPDVDKLLSTRGMVGMLNTIWLIICALVFGGIMESSGMLLRIGKAIVGRVEKTGSLICTTIFSCIFMNIVGSEQYMSIVVPSRMFRNAYRQRRLPANILSRTLEDGGTVTSVLVPWTTCSVYQSGVLALDPFTFIPYCFFNIITPVIAIIVGYTIVKPRPEADWDEDNEDQAEEIFHFAEEAAQGKPS